MDGSEFDAEFASEACTTGAEGLGIFFHRDEGSFLEVARHVYGYQGQLRVSWWQEVVRDWGAKVLARRHPQHGRLVAVATERLPGMLPTVHGDSLRWLVGDEAGHAVLFVIQPVLDLRVTTRP